MLLQHLQLFEKSIFIEIFFLPIFNNYIIIINRNATSANEIIFLTVSSVAEIVYSFTVSF